MLLVALGIFLSVGVASAVDTGSISGTVSNGTPGGGSPAGLKVTLSRFDGMNLAEELTATTDNQGRYSFSGLPINANEAFIARVTYLGVEYPGTMVLLSDNANPTVDIKIYETTNDPSVISLDSRGVIIAGAEPDLRLLDVFEILALTNKADRTYIGNNGEVLRLPLPDGTAQITPQPGFDFGDARIDRGALVTTGAIPPGQQNAMLSYSIPYQGTSATVTIGTGTPTQTLRVLTRAGTFDLESPALNDSGTVDVSGDEYHVLSVDKPIVGDTITVKVSKLPKAGSGGESSNGPLFAGIAAGVGLLAAGALVVLTLRRRSLRLAPAMARASVATAPLASPGALEDERLALATRLNELDEERAADRIDEQEYEVNRQALLSEIRALSRRNRGLEDVGA
jgi:hypothetical protein